ncbi:glycosyltransferase family protein [Thiocapsa marina]|nr:glycosyltransferase [Thiocapsa marina]
MHRFLSREAKPFPPGKTDRTALFICTQHWFSSLQVGMHHISRSFSKAGWRVGFLSAPIGVPHLLGAGGDASERCASSRMGGSRDPDSAVWHFVPFAPLPWGVSPIFARRSYVALAWLSARPGIRRALRGAGLLQPDFACADHFLHEGLLKAADPRISAFRRADNAAGFPGALSDFSQREADFARRSDLTIVTNCNSAQELAEKGVPHTLLVENGLLLDRFRTQRPSPTEYASDGRPVIVFVGAADARLDHGAILRAVSARSHYLWTFIGPFEGEFARRLQGAGALLPGPIPHDRLAGYLQHARVGIVPFSQTNATNLIRQVSSLKVFEYAASGLPIVGTRGCLYPNDLPVPLAICDSEQQFIDAIDRFVVAGRPAPPSIDAFDRYDWPQRLRPLFDWLGPRLDG